MPNYLNQEGDFRVQITEYGVKEQKSGAVCISAQARVLDRWIAATDDMDGYWESWAQYQEMFVMGDFYIVLSREKGNKLNDAQIQGLVEHCGWNGSLLSVNDGTWKPIPCRVSVEENTYKEKTYYKMSWLNAYDSTPTGMGKLDDAAIKRIESKHASAMRAIAGNVKRNATPPTEKPPSPPPVDNAVVATEEVATPNVGADDIPF